MRIETIEYKLYKFEELSKDGQQKALENNYDFNVDYDWWENVYSDAEEVGLKITSFDLDRGSYCEMIFDIDLEDVAEKIITNHGPMCETHKTAAAFLSACKALSPEQYDINIAGTKRDFCYNLQEDYRIILQKEYEYLTSEETIKESLIANEYEFTRDGKIF